MVIVSPDAAASTAACTESKSQPLAHTSHATQVPLLQICLAGHWLLLVQAAQVCCTQAGVGLRHSPPSQQVPCTHEPAQQRSPAPVLRQASSVVQAHAPQSTRLPQLFLIVPHFLAQVLASDLGLQSFGLGVW